MLLSSLPSDLPTERLSSRIFYLEEDGKTYISISRRGSCWISRSPALASMLPPSRHHRFAPSQTTYHCCPHLDRDQHCINYRVYSPRPNLKWKLGQWGARGLFFLPVVVAVTPFTVPSTSVSSSAKLISRDLCLSVSVLHKKTTGSSERVTYIGFVFL